MSAYYNEHDPGAAAWLRELIANGQIAAGDVDERSIADVQPGDLAGYTQCHFFAGIGGWSLALRLAGWPDTRPVWTGSCPCQPFSAAGKGQGGADDRHLWPVWFRLIRECRPEHVFGEQVAAAIGHGWLDLVSADLEGEGYALGAHVLGAHSVGAPHRRQRLWFVAESSGTERGQGRAGRAGKGGAGAHAELTRPSNTDQLGHADDTRPQGRDGAELPERAGECVIGATSASECVAYRGTSGSPWSDLAWLPCRDGKARPTQPGLFPLVARLPRGVVPSGDPSESEAQASAEARVMRLRGYGNAIAPQVAAEVIRAYMDITEAA
jgi:DNA (cytosine-5)-methyltransferase 1